MMQAHVCLKRNTQKKLRSTLNLTITMACVMCGFVEAQWRKLNSRGGWNEREKGRGGTKSVEKLEFYDNLCRWWPRHKGRGRVGMRPTRSISVSLNPAREEKPLIASVDDSGLGSLSWRFCRVILPIKNARFLTSAPFARSPDYLCLISEWSSKSAYLISTLAQTEQFSVKN